jgi:hypothetical protein
MSKLSVVKNQLPTIEYSFVQAVKDFRLLDQAEKGRDYILNLIKSDLTEFIAQANDLLLVDQDSGKWLLNFVVNHVVRRDGKYNSLLPVNMTISANKDKGLSFKTKSESELAKDAVLQQTSKLLHSILDNDNRKKLADMPTSSLSKAQDRLTAVQKAIEQQKADSIAKIDLNNARTEVTKALKLVPEGEFKTNASAKVLNTVEECKTLGDEINAFLKTDAKDPIVQEPKPTLEQPRDKPVGTSKLAPTAQISKESALNVQKVFDGLVNKLSIIEMRELSLKINDFLSDEVEQTGTN